MEIWMKSWKFKPDILPTINKVLFMLASAYIASIKHTVLSINKHIYLDLEMYWIIRPQQLPNYSDIGVSENPLL